MSNKTFNMSTDQVKCKDPLPHRDLMLGLASESHYSNSSPSPSPDSNSSISNLSDREASSSPDINMLECHLSNNCPVDIPLEVPYNTSLPQVNVLCGVSMNLNQTFFATPVNGNVNFWNENLSQISNCETESEKYQTFSKKSEDGSNSEVTSPDSAVRESQLGSCETSRRGSTENDCCSLSSGEMIIRSNSFCLEDQSFLLVSSLEESGHPALPAEFNLPSTTLLDICENSLEKLIEENTSHPCLGITFTQAELPTEENDMAASNSVVALPGENEGDLLMTFVCETSPGECGKEAQFASSEAQLLHFPAAVTPEQGNTFVSTLSAMQDTDKDIHTSTPVQHIGNKILSLPSFSESPCDGNTGSSGLHPVKRQQSSVTPKQHLVAGMLPSANKYKRMEIKKFPKSDFSGIKSKVVTRNVPQISVPGHASQHKAPQVNVNNKNTEAHRGATTRISPAKVRTRTAVVSAATKMVSDVQGNTGAANLGATVMQSSGQPAVDGQGTSRASPSYHHPAANKHASAVQCSNASPETEQVASSQVADAAAQQAGNHTFCLSSLEKSPDESGQTYPKPSPKKGVSSNIEVKSASALGQDKRPILKTRPRCSSESSSSSSRPPKEKRTTLKYSTSFTIPKTDTLLGQTKNGSLNCSSQNKRAIQAEAAKGPAENSSREVKKISLLAEFSKSTTAGGSWDESKSRFHGRPSPRQKRGATPSQPSATSHRSATLSTRQKQGTLGRDECGAAKAVGTPQTKQRSSTGSQRAQTAGDASLGFVLTANIKPHLNGSRPSQTPTRPSLMGLPPTPVSRLPRKTLGPSRSHTEASVHTELSEGAGSTQVSGGAELKPTPFKTLLKTRLTIAPVKTTGPSLATTCRPAASTSKGASNSTVSPLKRTASARVVRLTSSGPVDKNKPKASSRQQPPHQQASKPSQSNGPPDVVPASIVDGRRKDQSNQHLRGLLAASNCRFEAVAIVLQQTLAQRDEARKQCRDLSQELVNLRGELVCSVHSSERLEKERDELRVALEDALQTLKDQHKKDQDELEERLQTFYQAEWDKVHLTYQEEADKCKILMQEQMEEFKANHEAMKLELEQSHSEQLQCVKQQYEMSLEELSKVHNQELQILEKTLKDAEAALSGQIEALTEENNALIEKLTAEENRRKELAGKCQKDSHTLYLEQELESLKVVLDIKNKQLHQQEKKLMEVDKLKEKNVKLDESLKKVQQENEDLKARMDRHAALSRQLSTEQAVLQESLQKESKVNKRLSMENEELLWKLHNGDLSGSRRVSPTSTSPSHSISFQSPRSSGVFSSPPLSPR